MNEQDVRVLVRDAIERHLGGPAQGAKGKGQGACHSSHVILDVVPGSAIDEGMCLIEPAVRCNHCGFCQSYGH
jgi:hypothetical protein